MPDGRIHYDGEIAPEVLAHAAPFMLTTLRTIALHAQGLDKQGIVEKCDEAIALAQSGQGTIYQCTLASDFHNSAEQGLKDLAERLKIWAELVEFELDSVDKDAVLIFSVTFTSSRPLTDQEMLDEDIEMLSGL
jgi:hypothetical protein